MTKEEMDEFLQSIGGLENGIFDDRSPITDSYFMSVGPGWYPLIKELIEDLIALGWDKQVTQVKEKYGTLRFYINGGTDEIHDRIEKAEADSAHICEETGKPGKLRKDLGWIRTLSDEEYKKIPYISDNFQIGPDGAYEHGEDFSDLDVTLNDGLEDK